MMPMDTNGPSESTVCPLSTYTESSARSKLARHRKRGEDNWTMFSCPWGDHWHVIDCTIDEWIERNG